MLATAQHEPNLTAQLIVHNECMCLTANTFAVIFFIHLFFLLPKCEPFLGNVFLNLVAAAKWINP